MGQLAVRKVEVTRLGAWGHKCGFLKANGAYCDRWAIRGAYCCPKHGGSLPGVKLAAKARLRAMVPQALETLESLMNESEKDEVRLRAARHVLRLNGIQDTLPQRKRARQSAAHKALESGAVRELEAPDVEIEALLAAMTKRAELEPGGPA